MSRTRRVSLVVVLTDRLESNVNMTLATNANRTRANTAARASIKSVCGASNLRSIIKDPWAIAIGEQERSGTCSYLDVMKITQLVQ